MEIVTLANVTRPECGHTVEEEMPTDACQFSTSVGNAGRS